MLVLDLFCGLGGFSQPFRDRGHQVIGVDIVPPADVIADVSNLPLACNPDVIVGSPPCTEFSRYDMPWQHEPNPSLDLVDSFFAAVEKFNPRWWVMENVRGLARFWGRKPDRKIGSRYLWTNMPLFLAQPNKLAYGKWRRSSSASRERSKIPYHIGLSICKVLENAYRQEAE